MKVVALTADLMDRSKLKKSIPDIKFEADPTADVVICDLTSGSVAIKQASDFASNARIVCYGPHVDQKGMDEARAAGADVVLPRSKFFANPQAAITP